MAGRLTLDQLIGVRVPVPQFFYPAKRQGCFAGTPFYILQEHFVPMGIPIFYSPNEIKAGAGICQRLVQFQPNGILLVTYGVREEYTTIIVSVLLIP